jgi:hypothetical protein
VPDATDIELLFQDSKITATAIGHLGTLIVKCG